MRSRLLLGLMVCAVLVGELRAQGNGAFPGTGSRRQGGVIGRVYLDLDGNGQWSKGDRAVAGARVLTDSGLEATTDANGRYSLLVLSSGYEMAGSHLVKVDLSTLPTGAVVHPSHRRLVHLTPLAVTRVDFAVGLTEAGEMTTTRGIEPAGESVAPVLTPSPDGRGIRTLLAGRIPPGCRVAVGADPVDVDDKGVYQTGVTVQPGANPFLVTVQCPDGSIEFLQSEIHWVRRDKGGDLVFPARPEVLAVCRGPAGKELPRTAAVAITCRLEPGVSLTFGDRVSSIIPGENLVGFQLPVAPGENRFPAGLNGTQEGMVSWNVGRVKVTGALLGNFTWSYGETGSHIGGKIRGHLETELPEDFKLILGGGLEHIDKQEVGVEDFLAPAWNPWVHERNPDPEVTFLVSGDDSLVEDANPSNSRYLLRLQRKSSLLGWGSYQADLGEGDETGVYRRALLGAHASIRPLEDLFEGPEPVLDWSLEGFFAQPHKANDGNAPLLGVPDAGALVQLPGHEEFLATGGTLYFLANRWMVEGSEKIQVHHRDARTGMTLEHRALRPGVDYQADWNAGRVLLTEPLEQGFSTQGAVRLVPSGSTHVILVVDYEYLGAPVDRVDYNLAGGRTGVTVRPGADIVIRGAFSGLAQGFDNTTYQLLKGQARVEFGKVGELWAGYAKSEGAALAPAYSVDGGISFTRAMENEGETGEAYEAGGRVKFSWLEGEVRFRRWLDGFSDSHLSANSDLTQFSASVSTHPLKDMDIFGGYAGCEQFGESGIRLHEGRLGIRYRVLAQLALSAEGVFDSGDYGSDFHPGVDHHGTRGIVGARVEWEALSWLTLTAGHQQTLATEGEGPSSRDATLSLAGARVGLWEQLQLGVEGGWGPEVGNLVSFSLVNRDSPGGMTFANTTLSVDHGAIRTSGVTAGQSAPMGDGAMISTSQTYGAEQGASSRGQQVALEVPFEDAWRLKVAYQRTEFENPGDTAFKADHWFSPFFDRSLWNLTGPGRRNAVFARLGYLTPKLALSASGEYRVDEHLPLGPARWGSFPNQISTHRQTVLTLAGRWAVSDDLALGCRIAWAQTFGNVNGTDGPGVPEGGMLEGSLGLAWRPASLDWLRVMIRASAGKDERPESFWLSAIPEPVTTWFTGTLAVDMRPWKYLQPTVAVAPWLRLVDHPVGSVEQTTETGVAGLFRLGSEIVWGLGLAGEIRMGWFKSNLETLPAQDTGFDLGYGAELFYLLEGPEIGALRLSVGYSFSDLPDPMLMLPDLRTGRKGVFVRLEGML